METVDLKAKAEEINLILSEPRVNLWKLRELALTEGGLVNDLIRRRAWPKLAGLFDFYLEAPATSDNGCNNDSSAKPRGAPPTGSNAPPRPPRAGNSRPPSLPSASGTSAFTPLVNLPPNLQHQQNGDEDDSSFTSLGSISTLTGKKPVPPSLDAEQISRDVARCTWHLLTGTQRSRRLQMKNKHRRKVATLLKRKQRRLGSLINLTLLKTYEDGAEAPVLRYYQGYHDVASIFLCTLGGVGRSQTPSGDADSITAISASMGLDLPSAVLSQISNSHFRDAMQSNFMQLQTAIRLVLMPLICYFDSEVHDFLLECDMEPFFALSWIITWFSHDIRDTDLVKRLFDAFLVSHPLLPLYMTVAMVCHPNNRHEVLNAEPDFAVLHSTLSNLPKNSSMVGWKYRPTGEGYVSGDEGDDENSLDVSIFCDLEGGRDRDDDFETLSMVSSTVSGGLVKAPFQEIIDMSLDFMRIIPPRALMPLVKRYFTDEVLKPMLQVAPSISLLDPDPPKWGVTSTAAADWVLKQRARQREGRKIKKPSKRERRTRSTSSTRSTLAGDATKPADDDEKEDEEMTRLYITQKITNLAVIACGYGPGADEHQARRRKRRQRRIIAAGVAVAILAVALAALLQSKNDAALDVTTTSMVTSKTNHDVVFPGRKTGDIDTPSGDKKRTLARGETKIDSPPPIISKDAESAMEEAIKTRTVAKDDAVPPPTLPPRVVHEEPKEPKLERNPKEPKLESTHKEPPPIFHASKITTALQPAVKKNVAHSELDLTSRDEEFVAVSLVLVDKVFVSTVVRANYMLLVALEEQSKIVCLVLNAMIERVPHLVDSVDALRIKVLQSDSTRRLLESVNSLGTRVLESDPTRRALASASAWRMKVLQSDATRNVLEWINGLRSRVLLQRDSTQLRRLADSIQSARVKAIAGVSRGVAGALNRIQQPQEQV